MSSTRYVSLTTLACLLVAGSAYAYDGSVCHTPYHGGPVICSQPGPPAPPAPVPTCPDGYIFNPYQPNNVACMPIPSQEPPAGDSGPSSSNHEPGPSLKPVPAVVPFRPVPEPASGDVFATIIEQGPAADLVTIGLRRVDGPDALFWSQPASGAWWLVIQSIAEPDCILSGSFAPNLNLVPSDLDDDWNDDLLAHDPASGLVYRLYLLDLGHCSQ